MNHPLPSISVKSPPDTPCRNASPRPLVPVVFRISVLLCWFALFLVGCAGGSSSKICKAPAAPALQGEGPRRVAILPFHDCTGTDGLAEIVRKSLYAQASLLPYIDVELPQVDQLLRANGIKDQAAIQAAPPSRLGRILHCDVLVYGDVTTFDRIFAGIYSSLSVGAAIRIWDVRTDRKIWEDKYTARSQEGGVPLTLVDLPLITVRSGMNLRNAVKIQAVDELTRYLVERMPAPSGAMSAGEGSSPSSRKGPFEIRVAAFSDPERAEDFRQRLNREGFTALVVRATDPEGRLWHRVVVGPYLERAAARAADERLRRRFPRCDTWIALSSSTGGG